MKSLAKRILVPAVSIGLLSCQQPVSVLTGNDQQYSVDGGINDGDDSTQVAGSYSSLTRTGSHQDGFSTAGSQIASYKQLHGTVTVSMVAQSQGPFSGAPSGVAGQKVRSSFTLPEELILQYSLAPEYRVDINSTGTAAIEILMSVHDAVTGGVVQDSIATVHYSFRENADHPHLIDYVVSMPGRAPGNHTMGDDDLELDASLDFAPFVLPAGNYHVLFELIVKAGGDTDFVHIDADAEFDLLDG